MVGKRAGTGRVVKLHGISLGKQDSYAGVRAVAIQGANGRVRETQCSFRQHVAKDCAGLCGESERQHLAQNGMHENSGSIARVQSGRASRGREACTNWIEQDSDLRAVLLSAT